MLFPGKPGPVTLVNLVGRRGTYRMGVAYGQAVPTGMVFPGNPTKVVLAGGVLLAGTAALAASLAADLAYGLADPRVRVTSHEG